MKVLFVLLVSMGFILSCSSDNSVQKKDKKIVKKEQASMGYRYSNQDLSYIQKTLLGKLQGLQIDQKSTLQFYMLAEHEDYQDFIEMTIDNIQRKLLTNTHLELLPNQAEKLNLKKEREEYKEKLDDKSKPVLGEKTELADYRIRLSFYDGANKGIYFYTMKVLSKENRILASFMIKIDKKKKVITTL